jgi:endonuclease/exonuclease/phosphatase family metal-dependent hydrolase
MERLSIVAAVCALAPIGCGGGADGIDGGASADVQVVSEPVRIDVGVAEDAALAWDGDYVPEAGAVLDAPRDGAAEARGFTVLTINLRNAYIDASTWPQRRMMFAAFVNAMQPDVVAMQEVVEAGGTPNGAEQIAALTPGYEWRYHRTHMAIVFEEGLGVLSRWPIESTDVRELPHVDLFGTARRSVLRATVTTPAGPVRLFVSHMTVDTSETVKADQAAEIVRFVDANPGPLPGFLAGDLNAEPDTLAMRLLRGEATHDGETGDYTDSWLAIRPTDPGFTIPSDAPDRRIDYVYTIDAMDGTSATVRSCEIVFDVPEMGVYASDHLGVLCEYEPL